MRDPADKEFVGALVAFVVVCIALLVAASFLVASVIVRAAPDPVRTVDCTIADKRAETGSYGGSIEWIETVECGRLEVTEEAWYSLQVGRKYSLTLQYGQDLIRNPTYLVAVNGER
ncbi:hypothetical protein [Pseudonocardia adelaidensis]|uniref:DUF4333 domain-containing protein n=1 Tax=Pseudonocardia adelaidensis TaxID=648754 RepID=A0ABP9NV15_9PSEU